MYTLKCAYYKNNNRIERDANAVKEEAAQLDLNEGAYIVLLN